MTDCYWFPNHRSYSDDSEWKQKLAHEKKQTRILEKSIRKLNTELEAVDKSGATKKVKSKCGYKSSVHCT